MYFAQTAHYIGIVLLMFGIFLILLGVGIGTGEISNYTAMQWVGYDVVILFLLWLFKAPLLLLVYFQFAAICMLLVTILGRDPEVHHHFHFP